MDEVQVISAAKTGQLSAFNQLVMHYQGLAYNVAFRILNDPDTAADATQEAFIKAFKSMAQYSGGSFKSWLMRIVTNTCYDQLRYDRRRPTDPLDGDEAEDEYDSHLIDTADPPEATAVRHELSDMLQACIHKLPPDQRVVLVLRDVEGFNYDEIAQITEVSLGTVKSRLNRARNRMKTILLQQELLPAQYRLKSKE